MLPYLERENQVDSTSLRNKRASLIISGIIVFIVLLILISRSPSVFLNWFTVILTALALSMACVLVFVLSNIVIAAIIHRYARKRFREMQQTENEPPTQQQQRPRPHRWENNGC